MVFRPMVLPHRRARVRFRLVRRFQGTGWLVTGRVRQTRDIYQVTAEIAFRGGGARETKTIAISAAETAFSFLLLQTR